MPFALMLDDIKREPKLMKAYLAFALRSHFLNEVKFYFDKGNAEALYPKYIAADSSEPVNIDAKALQAAEALVRADRWDGGHWAPVITAAKKSVGETLQNEIGKFLASKEYGDYVKAEKMGDPSKAAKLLGISDVRKLTDAMFAHATGDAPKAKTLLEELLKKEKLAERVEAVIKVLESL